MFLNNKFIFLHETYINLFKFLYILLPIRMFFPFLFYQWLHFVFCLFWQFVQENFLTWIYRDLRRDVLAIVTLRADIIIATHASQQSNSFLPKIIQKIFPLSYIICAGIVAIVYYFTTITSIPFPRFQGMVCNFQKSLAIFFSVLMLYVEKY